MKKYLNIAGIILILMMFYFITIQNTYLEITNLDSGEHFYFNFPEKGIFSIRYLHSYDKTLVIEKFGIDKKLNIIPEEVIYSADTYDIRETRYPDSEIEVEENYVRIYDIKPGNYDHFPEILINIKNYEPQYLSIKTEEKILLEDYSFLHFGEKGDLIKINVVYKKLLNYLIERSF